MNKRTHLSIIYVCSKRVLERSMRCELGGGIQCVLRVIRNGAQLQTFRHGPGVCAAGDCVHDVCVLVCKRVLERFLVSEAQPQSRTFGYASPITLNFSLRLVLLILSLTEVATSAPPGTELEVPLPPPPIPHLGV
jgi:hypothetical protein